MLYFNRRIFVGISKWRDIPWLPTPRTRGALLREGATYLDVHENPRELEKVIFVCSFLISLSLSL